MNYQLKRARSTEHREPETGNNSPHTAPCRGGRALIEDEQENEDEDEDEDEDDFSKPRTTNREAKKT